MRYHRFLIFLYWGLFIVSLWGIVYALYPFAQTVFTNAREGELTAMATLGGSFLLALAFFWRIRKRQWQIPPLSGVAFLYVLWCIVENLLIYHRTSSSPVETRWLLGNVVLPLLYVTIVGAVANVRLFATSLRISLVVLLVLVILLTFTDARGHFPSLDGVLRTRYRVYLFSQVFGPVTLATLSALLFLLTASFLMYYPKHKPAIQATLSISLVVSLIGLIASGGRSAWVGSIINFLIIVKLSHKKVFANKRSWILLFIIILGSGLIFHFLLQSNNELRERLVSLPNTFLTISQDKTMSVRMSLWADALKDAQTHPFGIGFGLFSRQHGLTTHNEYLNILLGGGYIGFVLFLIFLGGNIIAIAYKAMHARKQAHAVIAGTVLPLILLATIVGLTETWSEANMVTTVIFWESLIIGAAISLPQRLYNRHLQPAKAHTAPGIKGTIKERM